MPARRQPTAVETPTPAPDITGFAARLLVWYDRHGRKDLPWQQPGNAYAVWVSEIMLQQTQVGTVIPYFHRFMNRFPDVTTLAGAELDEVLHLWTGLGYYARARNLHAAAAQIIARHGGEFPRAFTDVAALPGVGRSTAGAILAQAFNQRHPILDGNAKRVLARYFRVAGYPGDNAVSQRLWQLADAVTPCTRAADYTQAIMDLGATVCRRRPECARCPQAGHCAACAHGDVHAYPAAKPRKPLPEKTVAMILIRDNNGGVLLFQRPPAGIWGSLWSLPECDVGTDVKAWCRQRLGLAVLPETPWPVLRHTFTHFRLHITPIPAQLLGSGDRWMETRAAVWYKPHCPDRRGLAAPVKRLLEHMRNST